MRRVVTIAALLLAGCGNQIDDATCAELARDPAKQREMTRAVQESSGGDRELSRAMWETICANSRRPERDQPFREAVRQVRQVD